MHPWHDVELPRYLEEPIPAIIKSRLQDGHAAERAPNRSGGRVVKLPSRAAAKKRH